MNVEIRQEPTTALAAHVRVPISFWVTSRLKVHEDPSGVRLEEIPVGDRFKDYDAEPYESPAQLAQRFDLQNWGLLSIWVDGARVGGSVLACRTPGVSMLEGRDDLALVWDLRIAPERRGAGLGRSLWQASEAWARQHDCKTIKVETQDVNVVACRFYESLGCTLRAIDPHAYPASFDEVQFLWYKELSDNSPARDG